MDMDGQRLFEMAIGDWFPTLESRTSQSQRQDQNTVFIGQRKHGVYIPGDELLAQGLTRAKGFK